MAQSRVGRIGNLRQARARHRQEQLVGLLAITPALTQTQLAARLSVTPGNDQPRAASTGDLPRVPSRTGHSMTTTPNPAPRTIVLAPDLYADLAREARRQKLHVGPLVHIALAAWLKQQNPHDRAYYTPAPQPPDKGIYPRRRHPPKCP